MRTAMSKTQLLRAVPTKKTRRFSWNFMRPSPSLYLDPSAYQEPVFIAPRPPAELVVGAMQALSDGICPPQALCRND
jgi:hypothetical protein